MIQLPISRGLFALIDDADFEILNQYKWSALKTPRNTFYAVRRIRNNGDPQYIYMHRQIIGAIGVMDIDHIDGNGLNNQRENLRECTRSQNLMNRGQRKNRKYGAKYKGVSWYIPSKKWKASIGVRGLKNHIGYFLTQEEAALAYNKAAKELFGEFANLNKIP